MFGSLYSKKIFSKYKEFYIYEYCVRVWLVLKNENYNHNIGNSVKLNLNIFFFVFVFEVDLGSRRDGKLELGAWSLFKLTCNNLPIYRDLRSV